MRAAGTLETLLLLPPEEAAPELLGSYLVSSLNGETVRLRITEVEAYKGEDDPASHAFKGRSERNASMFGPPGTLYTYRSYGIHTCANTAAGPEGVGWGILIRGGEVVEGDWVARRRRGRSDQLTNGPGKVAQALGITLENDGHHLLSGLPPIWLEPGPAPQVIVSTPRIGVSKAADRPWRFVAVVDATR
jgi:DNA-3-methyladenine glycosylase